MDWNDPAARARHIKAVGPEAYNRDFAEHIKASTVATVNGHDIRPVLTRFGRLFAVGSTGTAFSTMAEAKDFANKTK